MKARYSITIIAAGLGCSSPPPDKSAVTDTVNHETMTADQHSAMHETSTLNDSAFAELQKRGATVMGVDQYQSSHKFDITADGGRIELQRSANDSLDIAQIRAHMKDIQKAFVAGDFANPFAVHDREMPGTAVMKRKKARIRYVYSDLPRGAELRLVTDDPDARAAIAEFMKAQRGEHRSTGANSSTR